MLTSVNQKKNEIPSIPFHLYEKLTRRSCIDINKYSMEDVNDVEIPSEPKIMMSRLKHDIETLKDIPTCKLYSPVVISQSSQYLMEVIVNEGYWSKIPIRFRIVLPLAYPYKPPSVKCLDSILHPNIDLSGAVCLNELKLLWRPSFSLFTIGCGLSSLLISPVFDDCINQEVPDLVNKGLFNEYCKTANQLILEMNAKIQ